MNHIESLPTASVQTPKAALHRNGLSESTTILSCLFSSPLSLGVLLKPPMDSHRGELCIFHSWQQKKRACKAVMSLDLGLGSTQGQLV